MLRLNQIFLLLFLSINLPFGLALASSGKGGMPQLNPASFDSQIFWLIIIFTLLFLLVNYVFLPKISGIKRNREDLINYNLNLAEENNLKVKKINEEISMLIEESKNESEKLIKSCHESNMNNLNTELQKVIKQLDQKEKKLFLDIQMKEQEIKKNIYKYSKDLAEQIYRKILNKDKAIKLTDFKFME
tara:strand:+ start:1005 stop:1568 length:564 start_codon:yes stop_codon:yes gene_type:complete